MKHFMIFLAFLAFGMSYYGQSFLATASVGDLLVTAEEPRMAVMHMAETQHDFGQVPQHKAVQHRFEFTNQGDAPLVVESVKPSCSCTVTDYSKGEILPGESGYIMASYNAKHLGVFHKSVTVRTNTEAASLVLRLKGEVVSAE